MSDWVNALANEWGHWMRKSAARDGAIQGIMGRLIDEGADGAAIRSYGDSVPYTEFPLDVSRFHRAWRHLEPHEQNIIFIDYRLRDPLKKKLKATRMSKSAYYRLRKRALENVARIMAMAA